MFKFTVRDVLWLMVVAALAAALFAQHKRAEQAQLQSEKALAVAAQAHEATKKELAELTAFWNSLNNLLKFNGVMVVPGSDMIHWKGKEFPVDFKTPVDPAAGDAARTKAGTPLPLPAKKP